MSLTNPTGAEYITLDEAKEELAIDAGLTIHDTRVQRYIGAAIDWAENYTQRSLCELMELNSPTDSETTVCANPVDSPGFPRNPFGLGQLAFDDDGGFDWGLASIDWPPEQWHWYWKKNPVQQDDSRALRRDVKTAILMYIQVLFDRDPASMELITQAALDMLTPYRQAWGV